MTGIVIAVGYSVDCADSAFHLMRQIYSSFLTEAKSSILTTAHRRCPRVWRAHERNGSHPGGVSPL
jgi:hypothetical protein